MLNSFLLALSNLAISIYFGAVTKPATITVFGLTLDLNCAAGKGDSKQESGL